MNLARISKKTPHKDNRKTLLELHKDEVARIERKMAKLPQKRKQLEQLERKSKTQRYRDSLELKEHISQLKGEIYELENQTELTNYLIKAAPYILEYREETRKYKEGNKRNHHKGNTCRRFMENVLNHAPNIKMKDDYERQLMKQLYCYSCKSPREVHHAQAIAVCTQCGETIPYQDPEEFVEFLDEVEMTSPFAYKRVNHFKEWLAQMQAKESTPPPDYVIDMLLDELIKARVTPEQVTYDLVKQFLKKLRLNKQYEHIPRIINRICNKPPPIITRELERKLVQMFEDIQEPFNKHCPPERKNFLSYSYTLHKLCQLLGQDHLLPCFPLLKSREKLYAQDQIWKGICQECGYTFIPSL